jgi:peptidyl-prolyl cis-trans isomerase B (cyclophilin B)
MKPIKSFVPLFLILLNFQVLAQTQFTGKPMYQITTTRGGNPLGSFTVELFPNIAPKHARNFDSLVSQNFYDSTAFHRCIPGFMIQGGDPNSRSGPISTWGYGQASQPTVPAEFSVARHLRGILSAARKPNPLINSATSQFFICVATASNLDGQYSVYGRVTKGMNYVDTIVLTPKMTNPGYTNMPLQKIEMFINYIGSNDTVPNAPTLSAPANHTVGIDSAINLQLKWNAVSDAIIYQIHLSTDSTFVNDTVLYSNSALLIAYKNGFKGNTRYFWRVRANNGGHFSSWSDTWDFHTKGETTGLSQNTLSSNSLKYFPNPGSALFQFENLKPGSLIEVFDNRGRAVLQYQCKSSSQQLDLSKQDKGVYTVRLTDMNGAYQNVKLIVQ